MMGTALVPPPLSAAITVLLREHLGERRVRDARRIFTAPFGQGVGEHTHSRGGTVAAADDDATTPVIRHRRVREL